MKNLISEVQIVPVKPNNGLIAFASFVLDDKLYLSSIGIHKKLDGSGYRLTYPSKLVGSSKEINIFHPITKEFGKAIEEAVFERVKKVMEECNDRHSNIKYPVW